jgi:hypothetical protein
MKFTILTSTLLLTIHSASAGNATAINPGSPVPQPAPHFHPNAHGAHRPTADLSQQDGFGLALNIPFESILYYRGNRMGENGVPVSIDMDVKLADHLIWANNYKFCYFMDDETDTKIHLLTAVFYQMGPLSIGPGFKFHRNNTATTSARDAYDLGLQALYDFGLVRLGAGYSYDLESEGHYLELGVSASIKITDKLTITPAAEITYIDGWVRPVQGMNNLALRLTATYKLCTNCSIAPFIAYNLPLEATEDRYPEEIMGGAALQFKF